MYVGVGVCFACGNDALVCQQHVLHYSHTHARTHSEDPYVASVDVSSDDEFVVLACDGVWDELDDQVWRMHCVCVRVCS
jgi:serine/threonine protein phosphatase PrpC